MGGDRQRQTSAEVDADAQLRSALSGADRGVFERRRSAPPSARPSCSSRIESVVEQRQGATRTVAPATGWGPPAAANGYTGVTAPTNGWAGDRAPRREPVRWASADQGATSAASLDRAARARAASLRAQAELNAHTAAAPAAAPRRLITDPRGLMTDEARRQHMPASRSPLRGRREGGLLSGNVMNALGGGSRYAGAFERYPNK